MIHDNPAWLAAAHPLLPPVRLAADKAGRRYLAGWAMQTELHTLNEQWLEQRAGGEDSERALRGTAQRLYVQVVLAANNPQLPPLWTPRRFLRYLRWAWMIEGAAQYFSGQVPLFKPAVLNRMRAGSVPNFPPARRDAVILGGTVFDMLERERGPAACELLVHRLRRNGPRGNIELAFDAPIHEVEEAWRIYLSVLANPPASRLPGDLPAELPGDLPGDLVEGEDDERKKRRGRQQAGGEFHG